MSEHCTHTSRQNLLHADECAQCLREGASGYPANWRQEPPDSPGWWWRWRSDGPYCFRVTELDIAHGDWACALWAGPLEPPPPPVRKDD
jgi:hypothetical protein